LHDTFLGIRIFDVSYVPIILKTRMMSSILPMCSNPVEGAFGMRLFDVGHFHVGFGIVAPSDDETTEFSIQGMMRNGRVPLRHSLAITLYADSLRDSMPLGPELEDVLTSMLAGMVDPGEGARRAIGVRTKSRKRPTRTRKCD